MTELLQEMFLLYYVIYIPNKSVHVCRLKCIAFLEQQFASVYLMALPDKFPFIISLQIFFCKRTVLALATTFILAHDVLLLSQISFKKSIFKMSYSNAHAEE